MEGGEGRWSGRISGRQINEGRGQRMRGEGDGEKREGAEVGEKWLVRCEHLSRIEI